MLVRKLFKALLELLSIKEIRTCLWRRGWSWPKNPAGKEDNGGRGSPGRSAGWPVPRQATLHDPSLSSLTCPGARVTESVWPQFSDLKQFYFKVKTSPRLYWLHSAALPPFHMGGNWVQGVWWPGHLQPWKGTGGLPQSAPARPWLLLGTSAEHAACKSTGVSSWYRKHLGLRFSVMTV